MPLAERTIEFRADEVLQNRSPVIYAGRVFLTFFRLCDHIPHDRAETPRSIELDLEWLARKKLMNALHPERLDRIKVNLPLRVQLVQNGDIFAHVVETAARRAASFRRQHAGDAVTLQDRLHGPFAQAENLAATFCQ